MTMSVYKRNRFQPLFLNEAFKSRVVFFIVTAWVNNKTLTGFIIGDVSVLLKGVEGETFNLYHWDCLFYLCQSNYLNQEYPNFTRLNRFKCSNISKIKEIVESSFPTLVEWREHLHANPELSFKEEETSAFVASKLEAMGIPFEKGVAGTGIVALIKGRNPEKQCLALRADLDALPIVEENDVPYKSKIEGVMHACGHDVHTTCLLGAAKVIQHLKEEFEGTVKLIFSTWRRGFTGRCIVND